MAEGTRKLLCRLGAVGETDIDHQLAAMHALDLVHPEGKSGDYMFKHALVRDALYQSLLTEARTSLHLKIAEEIERRSGNRLVEVAEVLAHHYCQTDRAEKAFTYLSMAGNKSLSVYSLDEASTHLTAALSLIDKDPTCVSDDAFTDFFVCYALLSTTRVKVHMMIDVTTRYLSRINRIGDDQRAVIIRHHFVFALLWNTRYRDASVVQLETTLMAERLGDSLSMAYALAGQIIVSAIFAPKSLHEFEKLKRDAIQASSNTSDAYIQNWTRWVIGWDAMHRGRINDARDSARELIQIGRKLNDPRSTGFGLNLLGHVAIACDSFADALEYSDQSLSVAVTGWDRVAASIAKGMALALLRRTEEAEKLLQEQGHRIGLDGDFYCLAAVEPMLGVCTLLRGDFAGGIGLLEKSISRRDSEGYRFMANWVVLNLAEVYLEIIGGSERPPLTVLLKNLPFLLQVRVTAFSRIRALLKRALENQQFDTNGYFIGKSETILGLLYKIKKKPALAAQHLTNAKRILTQFGQTPLLARVETALAELGV